MIKAVVFDLWGTLIYDDPEIGARRTTLRLESSLAALARLGHVYEPADIQAAFLAAGTELERIHATERDISARGRTILYLRHLDPSLAERLDDDAWLQMDDAILAPALTHAPPMLPGADEALVALRALGLRIGLISNAGITPGVVLAQILDSLGLGAHLDVTIFSDEVELSKPARAIFEHALEELGLTPQEVVFVGDQPVLDVRGARDAGLWMVQIGDLPPDGAEPHAKIEALSDLLPALRSLALVG